MQIEKTSGTFASAFQMVRPIWHHLTPDGSHAAGELYQTSLMSALLDGVYEGTKTYGDLLKHGDFGLGTFNDLDGEMVGFDGHFYQLRSDGSASPVTPDEKTPFAVVTFFRPEQELHISESMTKQQLIALLEDATNANVFSAIRISGTFEEIETRTVKRQVKPFPPLTEATAHEAMNTFTEVSGTLAGFRTPAYAQGLGVAGFHMHYIREDKQVGGHALDYITQDVVIQIATLGSFHVELPSTSEFLNASLSGDSIDQAIKSSEG